jgi:hypothetical protein
MQVSKFIKAHKDILIEYIYDDGNNISEGYNILVNSRDNTKSFVSIKTSGSNNTGLNQLFPLDRVTNYYGVIEESKNLASGTTNYPFLQYKNYSSGFPIRFDTLKIHVPINYTFGEYLGCYVRVYTLDKNNRKPYDLSNFYFDNSDTNLTGIMDYSSPPILFQERLWGKYLNIEIPSAYYISRQMSGTAPKNNSVNSNLTDGLGLSQTAPVFIEFSFIVQKKVINSLTNYYISSPTRLSFPQVPEFENLGVKIEHSKNGDFFEIYGIFNGSSADFKKFIDDAKLAGNNYYVEYSITLFEQNLRGKTLTVLVNQDFTEKIEYRPILKYTTTTAVIDVEMRLVDAVDDSIIFRRASYGILQDEVSKYSKNLTKINLDNANKPKIYSVKNINPSNTNLGGIQTVLEPIKIDHTVLVDKFNLIAKSDNVVIGKNIFFGIGKLLILLQPFDNVLQFIIARDVSTDQTPGVNATGNLSVTKTPDYLDMTNMGEISFVIKSNSLRFETPLYNASNSVDLSRGQVVFRIPESSMTDIIKIFESGQNLFYITSKLNSNTTAIYTGLYGIFNSQDNIAGLNDQQEQIQRDVASSEATDVLTDTYTQNTAVVYRSKYEVITGTPYGATAQSIPLNASSNPATTKIDDVTYTITQNSSLVTNGFEWTTQQIKTVLLLDTNPFQLSFRTNDIFTGERFLDDVEILSEKLKGYFITTPESMATYDQTIFNFTSSNTQ